jgi:hypothetical protein
VAISAPFFYGAEKYKLPILTFVGVIFFLLGLFVAIFTVREVLWRMEEEGTLLFRRAITATLYGYLLLLCFIPIIGPLIERLAAKEKAKNPFIVEDANQK